MIIKIMHHFNACLFCIIQSYKNRLKKNRENIKRTMYFMLKKNKKSTDLR